MLYEKNKPVKVTSVVISTQHSKDLNQEKVREIIIPYIKKSIPQNLLEDLSPREIYINPTGQFIIGGPDGDTGLTGRKNNSRYLRWSSSSWWRSVLRQRSNKSRQVSSLCFEISC